MYVIVFHLKMRLSAGSIPLGPTAGAIYSAPSDSLARLGMQERVRGLEGYERPGRRNKGRMCPNVGLSFLRP